MKRGRLLLAERHRLVMTPNGNGGLFRALNSGGAFAHMQRHGLDVINYIQVDNPLAPSCDATFIGFHLQRGSEFSCLAMPKSDPAEKVGNFARVDGRLAVVEYTEIPQKLVGQSDARGGLLFGYANPGVFLWSKSFAQRQSQRTDLPVHRAHKKIPCIDEQGQPITPDHPNGYKLELFVFDTLPDAESTLLMACEREAIFAPVKNATGVDSPASARGLMTSLYRRWIEAAGGKVVGDAAIEISPLYALDEDELRVVLPADFVAPWHRLSRSKIVLPPRADVKRIAPTSIDSDTELPRSH